MIELGMPSSVLNWPTASPPLLACWGPTPCTPSQRRVAP